METESIQSGCSTASTVLPRTPDHRYQNRLSSWSKDEILKRVLELEHELVEFQESSKELENALEEELQSLEAKNDKLRRSEQEKSATIKELNETIRRLKNEINQQADGHREEKMRLDTEIRGLKQRLVEVEITNDNMESNDRLISSKLESVNQFNMELLEKIALLENDLHWEKKQNTEKSLHIINYENTINELQSQVRRLEGAASKGGKSKGAADADADDTVGEVDVSVLSMRDVLKAGPPVSPFDAKKNGNMRKSDSLQKLHELSMKTEGLSNKVRNLRRDSLYLKSPMKSPSTTQLSNHIHTSKSRTAGERTRPAVENKPKETGFEKSKTSKNLTTMLYKEAGTLDTISASPVVSRTKKDDLKLNKKKSRRGNILGAWFH